VGKYLNPPRSSARKLPRISFTSLVVAIVVLAVGAITVVSRQKLSTNQTSSVEAKTANAGLAANATAHDVHFHVQDDQVQQLSPEDAEKLAGGLRQLVNQSSEELVEVHHADGTVSVDLENQFQNVTVARVNPNGKLAQSCVDNPVAAGAFFGIDPKLIENRSQRRVTPGRSGDR
jgi:hypothetical protein